jgi:hypothetical protein
MSSTAMTSRLSAALMPGRSSNPVTVRSLATAASLLRALSTKSFPNQESSAQAAASCGPGGRRSGPREVVKEERVPRDAGRLRNPGLVHKEIRRFCRLCG